jgi:hypothetical protein
MPDGRQGGRHGLGDPIESSLAVSLAVKFSPSPRFAD